jgi:hypothetical protein
MTFDPKCLDLAQSFLSDIPELDAEKLAPVLARHIQETIEEFIEDAQTSVDALDLIFWTQMRPKKKEAV